MTTAPSSSSANSTLLLGSPLTGKTTRLVEHYRALVQRGLSVEKILCLSFFSANAESIRQALKTERQEFFPGVTTLQRFQTLLLWDHARVANLPARAREISPAARALVIRQAWEEGGGPLWREFGQQPGAIKELTKVIDWITQNRTRFAVAQGELGDHELAQVYVRYIELCARHRLLTFQEASLRCLDLLAEPGIAALVGERYPAVMVDDLHLARPDQLALVSKLREGASEFTATAWLTPNAEAPELQLIWQTIQGWGVSEEFSAPAPGVNPRIPALAQRATGTTLAQAPADGAPVSLTVTFTVEDELQAVAQAIVRALVADSTLQPADIVVVAASASLLPFAQRILADYGLPVAPLQPLLRNTPLIQGGLLALRWVREPEGRLEVERDLLALPYVQVHPLDRATLYRAAEKLEKTILTLEPGERPALVEPGNTTVVLNRVRRCLEELDATLPASQVIQAAVRELEGLDWAWRAGPGEFSQPQRDAWTSAYSAWVSRVAELEATIGALGTKPDDFVDLVAGLADQTSEAAPLGGLQLIDSAHTNGVHACLAFVVGLSEAATPLLQPEMQLLTEDEVPALFADGRAVILPCARQPAAWIERESRQLAALLSRGRERLNVSVSRYGAGGDAQLPSPFFERLLGNEGEIDRDGNLTLKKRGLWVEATPADSESPEGRLPQLNRVGTKPRPVKAAAQVLSDHTFSASQIRMYLTCPLQYFYGKVLNIEAEGSAVLSRGSLLHEVLCATLGDGTLEAVDLSRRKRPKWINTVQALNERAQAALAAAWTGEASDLPGGGRYSPTRMWQTEFGPDLQRQAIRRWASGILEQWTDYEVNGLPDSDARCPVLLEASFTMELGGYQLIGRIDRVDEVMTPKGPVYELLDYKTGSAGSKSLNEQIKKFLPPEGVAPTDYQLPLYALALGQGVGGIDAQPRAVSYYNLESLEKGKKGNFGAAALRTLTFAGGRTVGAKAGIVPAGLLAGAITDGIVATLNQMSASPYPAKPDFNTCKWCAFRAACDRGRAQGVDEA